MVWLSFENKIWVQWGGIKNSYWWQSLHTMADGATRQDTSSGSNNSFKTTFSVFRRINIPHSTLHHKPLEWSNRQTAGWELINLNQPTNFFNLEGTLTLYKLRLRWSITQTTSLSGQGLSVSVSRDLLWTITQFLITQCVLKNCTIIVQFFSTHCVIKNCIVVVRRRSLETEMLQCLMHSRIDNYLWANIQN